MTRCASCGNEATQDARFCGSCGAPLTVGGPAHETVRKPVTIVFADVIGSTALADRLDPESVWLMMTRYFEAMRSALERHGGTVEKFIGDAVMAVFGIPVVREDDALRAIRAAVEMRDALAELNVELERHWHVSLEARIGVNSGEVVAGDPSGGQLFATGDAVNVAARLEQAAAPGEILIGEQTQRLLDRRVAVERVEPLALKGKGGRVGAFRLLAAEPEAAPTARPRRLPFVGRSAELRLLRNAFKRCAEERACGLITVVGVPGVGKSRLVGEALEAFGADATVVVGRCPPYGEGITYLPLLDIVRQLAPGGRDQLASLVADDPDGELISERVAGAVGLSTARTTSDEAQWAARRLFEALAQRHPLVVVLDDVHWAEPTFLDLVEHVIELARDVPVLMVCLARPELLDTRPSWGSGAQRAAMVQLAALSDDEARTLVENAVSETGVRAENQGRILEVAEGNPLFLEQMLAMHAEDGSELDVPPTIQALLAARIDRLPAHERGVIQRAAVQGRVFSRHALAELVDDLDARTLKEVLAALERRELVHRDRGALGGDDAFRFAHGLVRDAAYQFLRKETRSELHERLAYWLERTAKRRLVEQEELVGFHLEQAYRYREDLGTVGERERGLAAEAAKRLDSSGRRALDRSDVPAAINLLERAAALLSFDNYASAELLPCLGAALLEAGRLAEAERVLDDAARCARTVDDDRLVAHALVEQLSLRVQVDTDAATKEIRRASERLRGIFEPRDDYLGLCKLWRLRGLVHWLAGQAAAADAAWGQAAEYAREAGDRRKAADIACWLASSAYWGPMPVEPAIRRCEAIRDEIRDDRYAHAWTLRPLAQLHAMTGRFAVARRLLEESDAALADLGLTLALVGSQEESVVAMLAGDAALAEQCLRRGYERLGQMGEKAILSTTAAHLAEAIYVQGRYEEAWRFTETSEAAAAPDDVDAQIGWRTVRAKVLAKNGHTKDGETLAREAVALAERTDWLSTRANALADLGEVLRAARRGHEAEEAIRGALTLYELKGNLVAAEKARALSADPATEQDPATEVRT